jgi:hypothetical protein
MLMPLRTIASRAGNPAGSVICYGGNPRGLTSRIPHQGAFNLINSYWSNVMSMHKMFFGTIVFLSTAFLAACGSGSGSSGAAGAAGEAGAAGAAGTIAVPSADTNSFVSTVIDTHPTLGTISNVYTLTGIDNTSAGDTRLRYYIYEGTSATAKSTALGSANVACTNAGPATSCGASGSVIDPREMTTDNATLTLASHVLDKTDGSITHLIICPGNEAGDAASCNSVALSDRGASPTLTGGTSDNATMVMQLVADTTSTNDFVALKADASGIFASDIAVNGVGVGKSVTPTSTLDATPLSSPSVGSHRTFATSKYYVATIAASAADNVTYAAISNGAIGTAVQIGTKTAGHTTINDLLLADGGTTTMMMVGSSDNVSVYTVGASSLTLWNDNLSAANLFGADNASESVDMAFAVSPRGNRAVVVGFYDNTTSLPLIAALSPTGINIGPSDVAYNIAGAAFDAGTSDNITGFISTGRGINSTYGLDPNAAAAWCNDGSAGGALWLAISADNLSGFTLSKWSDNGTSAHDYLGTFDLEEVATHTSNGTANLAADNITSLSMACDPDDSMPVMAIGYDSANGDFALAKFDNVTNTWAKLATATAAAMTAQDPVTVAVSSDGSAFGVGYAATTGDNASIVVFYDE